MVKICITTSSSRAARAYLNLVDTVQLWNLHSKGHKFSFKQKMVSPVCFFQKQLPSEKAGEVLEYKRWAEGMSQFHRVDSHSWQWQGDAKVKWCLDET